MNDDPERNSVSGRSSGGSERELFAHRLYRDLACIVVLGIICFETTLTISFARVRQAWRAPCLWRPRQFRSLGGRSTAGPSHQRTSRGKTSKRIDLAQHERAAAEHLRWCEKVARMSKDMTDKQQNAVALQPMTNSTLRTKRNQTAEERQVQDALEDDEVQEALKRLHARGKYRREEPA